MLITGPQQSTPLEKLSGGERKRLELLRILISRPNLLLADEPTNDLDIDTLSRLEFFLDSFPGCLCVASHDRFLLQRLCDRILVFRDGVVEECSPSVLDQVDADFFQLKKADIEPKSDPKPMAQPETNAAAPQKKKLSYKEESLLKELEANIPLWEQEIEQLDREIAEKGSSYQAVKELYESKQLLEKRLEEGMETWAELEELKESLQS